LNNISQFISLRKNDDNVVEDRKFFLIIICLTPSVVWDQNDGCLLEQMESFRIDALHNCLLIR